MPKALVINGYTFKFYSNENNEPPHVHIIKADGNAKYWLEPKCSEDYSDGFNVRENRDIRELVINNRSLLIDKGNEYFRK